LTVEIIFLVIQQGLNFQLLEDLFEFNEICYRISLETIDLRFSWPLEGLKFNLS